MAGTRLLVAGLAVAAVAAGSAAAAMPSYFLQVHARLAPVAGTTASGRFNGVLVLSGGEARPQARSTAPRAGSHWRLSWRLSLPAFGGPATATLRIHAKKGAASVERVLCTRCAEKAKGTIALKGSQAIRIANGGAVVVVRTPSAGLRGAVKGVVHLPVQR
jgi:hypothetical protein